MRAGTGSRFREKKRVRESLYARLPAGVLSRTRPVLENVSESAAACLLTMVQGNVLALGIGHWIFASQTGITAGVIASVALFASGGKGRWVVAGVLAVATAAVDYVVHPGGFGPVAAEAIVTGLGAGLLSLAVATLRGRRRSRVD